MSSTTVKPKNPLEPLATVVSVAFRFAVLLAAVKVIYALLGDGPLFGWGSGGGPSGSLVGVCLSAKNELLQHTSGTLSHSGMVSGVSASMDTASVCVAHPTVSQSVAAALTQLPTAVLFLGAFYLAQRLTRSAARDGVYTTHIARLMLILGWWLLAGEVAATVVEAFARMSLLGGLVTWKVDWSQWTVAWYPSLPVVLIGLSLITFARIMRLGVGMREDLEGTV
jgi:hypothetical protein